VNRIEQHPSVGRPQLSVHTVRAMKAAIILLVFSNVAICQTAPNKNKDLVESLMPDRNPRQLVKLSGAGRIRAVKELSLEQKRVTGKHAQEVAFLLAAFGSNYDENRDYLIKSLRGCNSPSIKHDCDEDTVAFLIELYNRGHHEVLSPLLVVGSDSYSAAGLEMLGSFSSDVLTKSPNVFLDTIRPLSTKSRNRLCELAGLADGGGIAKADLRQVRKQLKAIGGNLALQCLRRVEDANKPE